MKTTLFAIALLLFIYCSKKANAQVSPGAQSHAFQYLTGVLTPTQTVSPTTAMAWNSVSPPQHYSMSVTTSATGFSVYLEGSLDQLNWSNLATTTSAGSVISPPQSMPMLYFRARALSVPTNTAITVTAIGVPY